MLASLVLALAAAASPAAETPAVLSVPYLSQTDDLCGGAAAAMIFRYWGDRYADVQQFEPLIDRQAGGIRNDVLADAIRDRGWSAVRVQGSIEAIRRHLGSNQPVLLLIEDHPGLYHYVVAVGADDAHVYLHDPTWGPSRRYTDAELVEVWRPTRFWSLVVRPGHTRGRHSPPTTGKHRPAATADIGAQPPAATASEESSACDRLLDDAIERHGPGSAQTLEAALTRVRLECPADSRPVSELAGLRFAERRWRDAETLAETAVDLDPSDTYGWDVLGSSRYLADDQAGALQAWNQIDKPIVDSVQIEGLTRTQYALAAQSIGLAPATLLTGARLRLAARRLNEFPTVVSSRMSYQPDENGVAAVQADVVERRLGLSRLEWTAAGAWALVNRELRVVLPGGQGQGDVWTAGWRWWNNRPRVAAGFSAPMVGRLPGIWRVDLEWEAETYAAAVNERGMRQERLRGSIGVASWATADLRYELTAGVDSWDASKAASIGGTLERRALEDRLAFTTAANLWFGEQTFGTASLGARFRSSPSEQGLVWSGSTTFQTATDQAPWWAWAGAGVGRARPQRLRAHPLLVNGVIRGPAFGRQLTQATFEVRRWLPAASGSSPLAGLLGSVAPLGLAVFVDAAHAKHPLPGASDQSLHIDGGVGVRLRLPGESVTLRADYARGLRDGSQALTFAVASDW